MVGGKYREWGRREEEEEALRSVVTDKEGWDWAEGATLGLGRRDKVKKFFWVGE